MFCCLDWVMLSSDPPSSGPRPPADAPAPNPKKRGRKVGSTAQVCRARQILNPPTPRMSRAKACEAARAKLAAVREAEKRKRRQNAEAKEEGRKSKKRQKTVVALAVSQEVDVAANPDALSIVPFDPSSHKCVAADERLQAKIVQWKPTRVCPPTLEICIIAERFQLRVQGGPF